MRDKWIITQSDLQRWLKPEVYHIYIKKHDELYLKDTERFNQRFRDDRDFFISFFKKCLYYIKPEHHLQSFFNNRVNVNDVFFALNLYYDYIMILKIMMLLRFILMIKQLNTLILIGFQLN